MYGLEAGQEVQIFYDRETFAWNDIQFNGVGIGSVRGTYEWSDTLLAIDGTNIIKLIPNSWDYSDPGGYANTNGRLSLRGVKVDGKFYKGTSSDGTGIDLLAVLSAGNAETKRTYFINNAFKQETFTSQSFQRNGELYYGYNSLKIADIDNDGDNDIFDFHTSPSNRFWLSNNGDGLFDGFHSVHYSSLL